MAPQQVGHYRVMARFAATHVNMRPECCFCTFTYITLCTGPFADAAPSSDGKEPNAPVLPDKDDKERNAKVPRRLWLHGKLQNSPGTLAKSAVS